MDSTTAKPTASPGATRAALAYLPDSPTQGKILRDVINGERADLAQIIDRETGAGELAEALREVLDWTHGDADAGLDPHEDAECIAARIASLSAILTKYAPTP